MPLMRDGWLRTLMGPGRKGGSGSQAMGTAQPPKQNKNATVSDEIISHYEDLMNSGAFLYAFLDFNGAFLMMNQGMRAFWGRRPAPESILSCCSENEIETMQDLLRDARSEPVAALVPMTVANGGPLWMDVELSPVKMMGAHVIQLIGVNVTDWATLRESVDNESQNMWVSIMDSCPGLLCCVVDRLGKLIYASQGYRAVASRLFAHGCGVGQDYPPMRTQRERDLYDLIATARHGRISNLEIEEEAKEEGQHSRFWDFTAAPLRRDGILTGAVLRVLPVFDEHVRKDEPKREPEPEPARKPEPEHAGVSDEDIAAFLDAVSVPAAIVNSDGVCLAANELFDKAFAGADMTDIIDKDKTDKIRVAGRPFVDLIPLDTPVNTSVHDSFPVLLAAREGKFKCRLPAGDGEVQWVEVHVRPLDLRLSDLEDKRAVMLTCSDITILLRTQEQLQRVRETDYTTGLPNRQGMERILERETRQAVFDMAALSLMILDIDGFRRLNETRGYTAADHALKVMASILRNALSAGDIMGRWGGDEFMILTPRSTAAARLLGNSLRELARGGSFGREFGLTLSVGVAGFSADMDISTLVGGAYDAMVSAKHSGGDRTVVAERPGAAVSSVESQFAPFAGERPFGAERTDGVGTDPDYR